MHVPDFRAGERTYQLLEQVSGRAGRGERPGQVVIQTYWPDHPAVQAVVSGDGTSLYESEAADRRALGFPPFGRIANVVTSGPSEGLVREAAVSAASALSVALPAGFAIVGPSAAPLARVKGNWRWHFVVKAPASAPLPAVLRAGLEGLSTPEGVTRIIDIDPVGML
jgi:primosomal protein N' (replication factor Y)